MKTKWMAAAALSLACLSASAGIITANTGWVADQLNRPNDTTMHSPWMFTLSAGETATFKVTDFFDIGDSWDLYSVGPAPAVLASSAPFAGVAHLIVGDPGGELGWQDARFEKLTYSVSGAGDYAFSLVGDAVAGVPAGLFVRFDVTNAVPEPSSLALVPLALLGMVAAKRVRKKRV